MNRNATIAAIVGVALVVAIGISFIPSGGSSEDASKTTTTEAAKPCAELGDIPAAEGKPTTVNLPKTQVTGDVKTTVLEPGDGPKVTDSSYVTVDYLGVSCTSGKQFDSSWDRGQPITIAMPSATPTDTAFSVITGWNQGLLDQEQGSLVQLDIPSDLAYGANGQPGSSADDPGIAANDPLTFVVKIIKVSDTPPAS